MPFRSHISTCACRGRYRGWRRCGSRDACVDPDGPGRDLPWGIELRGDRIGGWLAGLESGAIAAEDAVYRRAGVVAMDRRTRHSAAFAAGHGAAVALLAAGFAPDDPRARNHPVIGVTLAPGVIADTWATLAQDPLLAAIVFVITRARMLAARSRPRMACPWTACACPWC